MTHEDITQKEKKEILENDRKVMRSRAMPVPRFRSRFDRVPRTYDYDPSKLTNEQIEKEIAELAVKIPDQSYSELREAEIEAKQFLLTAELKSRRDEQPKPTIEEITKELAQVKDELDEVDSRCEMTGIGKIERKRLRLEYVLKFLSEERGMINPDITMKEKKEIMENDRKARSTYHAIASSAADDLAGGRFAQAGNKQTVVGSSPISYPAQPSTSPWHNDPCGVEPPVGFSVEDQLTTGEVWEVQRSIDALSAKAGPQVDNVSAPTPGTPIAGEGASFRRRI